MTLDDVVPRSVKECVHNGGKNWAIYVWRVHAPKEVYRLPFECGSWRCRTCRRYEASVTYARIRDAFAGISPQWIVFLVLTLDRDGYASGKQWPDAAAAYKELSRMQNNLMKRLDRAFKRRGWTPIGSRWVATVEAHSGGMPHLNLMLCAPEWARELEQKQLARIASGATQREAMLLAGEVLTHAMATGWGKQSTAEKCRSIGKLNNYITKIAAKACGFRPSWTAVSAHRDRSHRAS
jgi:hypothetical protein